MTLANMRAPALTNGPAHGYAIIQEIQRRSAGAFELPEGTVYPVLHRLEKNSLLSSRWTIAESGRKRRTYTLTRQGRQALAPSFVHASECRDAGAGPPAR
jgi:DNA-binding PadR family transcriptional regulator